MLRTQIPTNHSDVEHTLRTLRKVRRRLYDALEEVLKRAPMPLQGQGSGASALAEGLQQTIEQDRAVDLSSVMKVAIARRADSVLRTCEIHQQQVQSVSYSYGNCEVVH